MRLTHCIFIASLLVFLTGCATTRPMPQGLSQLDPSLDCRDETVPISWDLRGELFTDESDDQWLVIYIDTGFNLVSDPAVELKAGLAVLHHKKDKLYYYHLGRQPRFKEFGILSVETPTRKRYQPSPEYWDARVPVARNLTETFVLERKKNSDCVKILIR